MTVGRAVVTGGSGFIGSHVVDKLVDAGYEVVVADPTRPHRDDVEHVPLDIMDLQSLEDAFSGASAVFHLAAVADVNVAAADPVGAVDLTVVGTTNVWEAARRQGVDRVVLASTVWVYGASSDEAPLDETARFSLADVGHVYTATKLACEMVAHSYHSLWGQEFTILRYGIPFGPRMRPALVIPRFVTQALAGDPITLNGDGSQSRNYVYVGDLADAHVLALSAAGRNEVFNLEGVEPVSLRQILELLPELLERHVDITYLPARAGDYDGRVVSGQHAADQLGWVPTTSFVDGLRAYVDWHLSNVSAPALTAAATATPAAATAAATVTATSEPSSPAAAAVIGEASPHDDPSTPQPARPRRRLTQHDAASAAVAALAVGWPIGSAADAGGLALRISWVFAVALCAGLAWWWTGRPQSTRGRALCGALLVLAAMWLLPQWTPSGGSAILAVQAGVGLGWLSARPGRLALGALAGGAFIALVAGSPAVPLVVLPIVLTALVLLVHDAPAGAAPNRQWRQVGALTMVAAMVCWIGSTSATATWFAPFDTWSRGQGQAVAITFSGGPHDVTLQLADTLADYGVTATFFVDGDAAKQRPDVVRALFDHGNLIANNGTSASGSMRRQLGFDAGGLTYASDAVREATGECPRFFRPQGRKNPWLSWQVHQRGMAMILGDVDPRTTRFSDAQQLASKVLSNVKPGSIIVLRDTGPNAHPADDVLLSALPLILDGLADRGLEPVRLDDLLGQHGTLSHCA